MGRLLGITTVLMALGSVPGTANAGDLWGSIYFSMNSTTGQYAGGLSWSYDSHTGARRGARQACSEQGGIGCREIAWFRNACGAIAVGQRDYGAGWGNSLSAARRISIAKCQKSAANCRIIEARCAKQDQQPREGADQVARRKIQSALAAQGFNSGPSDGKFGPRTRAAIKAWQRANGYTPTGRLTRKQTRALKTARTPSVRVDIQPGTPSGLQGGIAVSDPKMGINSDERLVWAFGWTDGTSSEALLLAGSSCRRAGGVRCTSSSRGKNFVEDGGCLSIAIGDTRGYGTGGSRTTAVAENNARVSCSMNDTGCRIIETQCAGKKVRFVDADTRKTTPTRAAKAVAVVLDPRCDSRTSNDSSGCWKELDNRKGCYVFLITTNELTPKARYSWSGSCAGSVAIGEGTLVTKFPPEDSFFNSDGKGTFSNGKMDGRWVQNFAAGEMAGKVYDSYAYRQEGSFSKGKPVGQWFIYSRAVKCWMATANEHGILVGGGKC